MPISIRSRGSIQTLMPLSLCRIARACSNWLPSVMRSLLEATTVDLSPVKGIRFTQGSPIFKDRIAASDSIMVERLRRNGAIFIGKTNSPEFGLGSQTYNNVYGTTKNAYDQARTSGGSSGGAAVATALRMQAVADGSDHAGS